MKSTILFCLLLVGMQTTEAAPIEKEQMTVYEAINMAGFQRMLTQRIAKSYLCVVSDLKPDEYKEHLKGSAYLFKRNLDKLKAFSPNEAVKEQYSYVATLWENYKFIYEGEFTQENARTILEYNNRILDACEEGVALLEKYAEENYSDEAHKEVQYRRIFNIINIAGRQRMLTQRFMLYTVAQTFGIGDIAANTENAESTMKQFKDRYKFLMTYENNTRQVDVELGNAIESWRGIEAGLDAILSAEEEQQKREVLISLLKLSDQVLLSFDEIVYLYEKIGSDSEVDDNAHR